MKKVLSLLLVLVMVIALAACSKPANAPDSEEPEADEPKQVETTEESNTDTGTASEAAEEEPFVGAEVRVYVTYRGEKFISYNESTPWAAPDGKTYKKGDLLPTWAHMQDSIGITINDVTPKSGAKEAELLEQAAATKFEDANIFVGSPRDLSDYGIQGYFLPLNQHLDMMPNFKAFLDANPAVTATLQQADGNIYLTPYFDDVDKLERMFNMRIDWVKALLDEDGAFDTGASLDTVYDAYYDYAGGKNVEVGSDIVKFDIAENVVTLQNALATKNGETLTQTLRDYIDANYMNGSTGYANRSDLFISSEAAYDADELVALMRAVKTNAMYLTGEDKDLTVYSVRRVKDAKDMRRFTSIWGARGQDSENGYYYFNENDELVDGRMDDLYFEGLSMMNELYQEGLILGDFDQAKGQVTDFRKLNMTTNDGFMTYDYAASTVALHDLIEDIDAFGTVFEGVVPPAVQWFSDDFTHFMESNRSVKTAGGWAVTANTPEDVLESALRLLDYPFSEEGLEVMTFGPQGLYWNERMEFEGKQVPKLIEQFVDDRNEYASGNWSNFLRGYVGSTLSVGHIKQTIAIESQVSNEHYASGIGRISASNTKIPSLSADAAPEMKIVPTIFPLNEDQIEALSSNSFGTYHDEWSPRIIKYGFGTQIPNSTEVVPSAADFKAELVAKGIELETKIMNQAYETTK